MKCDRMQAHLERWVDGEVSGRLRRQIEAHLKTCLPCQRQTQAYRALADELEQARVEFDVASPSEFTQAVLARARATARNRSACPAYPRWALASGLAAAGVILGVICRGLLHGPSVPSLRVAQGGVAPEPASTTPSPPAITPQLPAKGGEASRQANQEPGKRRAGLPTPKPRSTLQLDTSSSVGRAAPAGRNHETRRPQHAPKTASPRIHRARRGPRRIAPGVPPPGGKEGRSLPFPSDFWTAAIQGADGDAAVAAPELVQQRKMLEIEAEIAGQQEEIERRQRQTILCWRADRQREELYPSYAYDPPDADSGRCDQLLVDLGYASSL